MFEFEAFAVLKTKEFTKVNDCFQDKSNEEVGYYGLTLVDLHILHILSIINPAFKLIINFFKYLNRSFHIV